MRKLLQASLITVTLWTMAPPAVAAELANLRNGFSIRHERHETVGDMTRLYTGSEPSAGYIDIPAAQIESFEPAPPEAQAAAVINLPKSQDLKTLVNSASARTQVDADFIASVIRAESGNNPRAVSHKGAQGLMQLMPDTATKLGVKNSFDAADNVDGGVRYLRELLLRYDNDMVKALAAYNAGPQRVEQYHGVPPYRETHAYVARVINDYNRKKLAQRKLASASATSATVQPRIQHAPTTKAAVSSAAKPNPQTASVATGGGDASGSE